MIRALSMLVGGILFGLIILGLRQLFPARSVVLPEDPGTPTSKEYYKAQLLFGFFFVISLALVGGALWFGYQALTTGSTSAQTVRPDVWAFIVCGFFTTLGVGGLLSYFLMRCALDDRADLVMQRASQKAKMNIMKAFLAVYAVVAAIGIGLTLMASASYLRIEDNRVALNGFAQFSEVIYPIDQIHSVSYEEFTMNRQGKVRRRPHYKLLFCDGRVWTTKQFPFGIEDVAPYRDLFEQLGERVAAQPLLQRCLNQARESSSVPAQ